MVDVRRMPDVLDAINAILNNRGIVEIKSEKWKSGDKVVVVEQTRTVKFVYPPEYK